MFLSMAAGRVKKKEVNIYIYRQHKYIYIYIIHLQNGTRMLWSKLWRILWGFCPWDGHSRELSGLGEGRTAEILAVMRSCENGETDN